MKRKVLIRTIWLGLLTMLAAVAVASTPAAAQQQQRPNIIFIMGDDIGWANIGGAQGQRRPAQHGPQLRDGPG